MAKVDYVVRETGHNLKRNITLTLASMVTVAVSLSLVGSALLLRQGVENATARWRGGIEFIVFMNADATVDQDRAVQESLEGSPAVDEWVYVDQEQAYEEFQQLFARSPEMVEAVTPDILPPSYRVVPADPDAEAIRALGSQYEDRPGVREVVFAFDTVQTVQRLSRVLSIGILIVAGVLLFAAGLLILNTIRMAMYARRREVEVMKLVGATNWFIRIPFMLEGLIQGVVGAVIAVGSVYVLNNFFETRLSNAEDLQILQGFVVDSSEVMSTSIFILVVGMLVGAIGSGIAVSRFLDV
ncbi:MAG TPA: permease-like cell division protein FtsX [Acidimicrobiales bacterium]|nr:permease-like cell division protein FtsX [Acidimicrobiales bacterium]